MGGVCGRKGNASGGSSRRGAKRRSSGSITIVGTAGKGFSSLDERWGITRSVYSPERAKQMVWLAGLLPYKQAAQVFARIGQARVPTTSIWQQAQRYGEALKARQQHQQAQVSVERVVLPPAGQDPHLSRK